MNNKTIAVTIGDINGIGIEILIKLWKTKNSKGFHLEYGNSCMGYEIPGGLGVKMADNSREVYVICGDASYLMHPNTQIVLAFYDHQLSILYQLFYPIQYLIA